MNNTNTVVLTGATGFVGQALLHRFAESNRYPVRAVIRSYSPNIDAPVEWVRISEISGSTEWGETMSGADIVIHLAARVHVMSDSSSDPLAAFREINVAGTQRLGREAAKAGVRRFIFVSSIKVNGEQTLPGKSFSADDAPLPCDPYGISKMEAEQSLWRVAEETGMEVVVVRPPLVYGPGVKANFESMMRWIYRGVPLPIDALDNKRSLVSLDNLVSLIETCIVHPAAANQTFLVSDDMDISTPELARRIGNALGKPARLVPVPVTLLSLCMQLLGKGDMAQRLCGSLQVDISKTKQLLEWVPPVTLDEGFKRTAEAWLDSFR